MPVYPSYKIVISNPEALDLNGLRMPFKIPRSLWGDNPWDPNSLDMFDIDAGRILKWNDLPDLMGLVLFEISSPVEVNVYIYAGSQPDSFFDNWREMEGENYAESEPVAWFVDGQAIISESDNTVGNHVLIITNGYYEPATRVLTVNRNYSTGKTDMILYEPGVGVLTNLVRESIDQKLKFSLDSGRVYIYAYLENQWTSVADFEMPLLEAEGYYGTALIAGTDVYGKIYDEIKERPDSLTYEWYDYHTQEHYVWALGEAPWDTSNPSIDGIEAPEKAISGEAFHVEAATTDLESLQFVFGGISYPGVNKGEGVFSAEIEAPSVTEKTSLVLYARCGDLIEEASILIYPALPMPTRVKFLQNGSEISSLTMESGQVVFVGVLVESSDGETWSKIDGTVSASIVSFDGEGFEEMAVCKVEDYKILVEADLPVGVYYLQATIVFDSPVALERVQRLKIKVVVDRK
ncbi:MAG: hypothetical protein GX457_17290 [Thermotogaceae bacterium]|nr:hypothetical protein [Thermotogaceae bacterium]